MLGYLNESRVGALNENHTVGQVRTLAIARLWSSLRRHPGAGLLFLLFLLSLPIVNPHIRGDGNEYYAYVRSLIIDGDLQFENEYRRGDKAFMGEIGRASCRERVEVLLVS